MGLPVSTLQLKMYFTVALQMFACTVAYGIVLLFFSLTAGKPTCSQETWA